MAVLVIHLLEMVDVQQEDGEWPAVSGRTGHLALEKLHQVALVVQLRESIRDGEPVDSLVVLRFYPATMGGREELEDDGPQSQDVAGAKQPFTLQLIVVHERPVRRARIADKELVPTSMNGAVLPRDVVELQNQVAVGSAAQRRDWAFKRHSAAEART